MLPRLSPENLLHRIQQYFSFIGNITKEAIDEQDGQILSFNKTAEKMFTFLNDFKTHIDHMEGEFEHAVTSSQQMNGMLATYESTLLESYGDGRR